MALDEAGQRVVSFASSLRNASRLGVYADLLVEMFQSGLWRQYETGLGPERWRAHEFDYFLIAQDARYEDVVRVLSWNTVQAAKVAAAMMGPPGRTRRTLEQASASWSSGAVLRTTLVDLAQQNGWLKTTGAMKAAPVSKRAVLRVQHGLSGEAHARHTRAQRIPLARRRGLEHQGDTLIAAISNPDESPVPRDVPPGVSEDSARGRADGTTSKSRMKVSPRLLRWVSLSASPPARHADRPRVGGPRGANARGSRPVPEGEAPLVSRLVILYNWAISP